MNEIFKTLRDKFPFLSLIQKGDLEFVGIVQNQDANVISFTASSTLDYFTFTGVYQNVRFVWGNNPDSTTGKIDKVLYRA